MSRPRVAARAAHIVTAVCHRHRVIFYDNSADEGAREIGSYSYGAADFATGYQAPAVRSRSSMLSVSRSWRRALTRSPRLTRPHNSLLEFTIGI